MSVAQVANPMPLTCFIEVPAVRHPKGMESFSPGLRGTSYPGSSSCTSPTLQGLYQTAVYEHTCANLWSRGTPRRGCCNPFRVDGVVVRLTQGSSFLATLG